MKIIVDKANEAIIVTGFHNGQKIKATSICCPEDEFNESFGIELTKKKWKAKKTYARIKELDLIIRKIESMLNDFTSRREALTDKYQSQNEDIRNFSNNYFYIK